MCSCSPYIHFCSRPQWIMPTCFGARANSNLEIENKSEMRMYDGAREMDIHGTYALEPKTSDRMNEITILFLFVHPKLTQ